MDGSDSIEISEGEDLQGRRSILSPIVSRVVDALGGFEDGRYRMGDEVTGCLKDLKKLWRKDDTDDERTVARLLWEARVLPNDLIPILLATAGQGMVEDKRAIVCADLMTAMTWPIDMAEELKELDDELDRRTDYTQLLQSHLHYKAALLKNGVLQALFAIILPPLAKHVKERKERDGQIISVVLHLIRNLAFIKDLPANSHLSADQAEFSSLQSKLIKALSDTHIFDLLLTIAANTQNDPLLNSWNTLVLEILYLCFRGIKSSVLTMDQAKQPTANLHRLLEAEARSRREHARKATSRHSRFGTTISVQLNPNKQKNINTDNAVTDPAKSSSSRAFVLHRQQAISLEAGTIMDITKKQKGKKGNTVDNLARDDNLSIEARVILKNLATEFIEACFNPFLSAVLKDIRSERAKITEKDNLRLLYVTKWFLNFFLSMRVQAKENKELEKWHFGFVAEVTDRSWIVWVLKRMREAVEEKPKLWTELQAGIECLTQLLLLIDQMSSSDIADPALAEAADVLQQQLIYNGEVLDIALESLRTYKPGTQSLAYLDSSVYMAYALLHMLERWGKAKGSDMYVRQKVTMRKKKKSTGVGEEDGIPDVEEEQPADVEEVIRETMFTFEAFEAKFASADITHTLLMYLTRYKEFSNPEQMQRIVSLMHRQAVKAKAEGLFFKVSTLSLFKTVLDDQKSFPREQPYKDLVNLITFILRQFFKALAENSFLAIEAFYPKNRGNWKQYSSWVPEEKAKKQKKIEDGPVLSEVAVKKGVSWSDGLGSVIACLVEAGSQNLVEWTKEILALIIAQRQGVIEDYAVADEEIDGSQDIDTHVARIEPSAEALSRITDYSIPLVNDEQAYAATKNPHLKLLFRTCKFCVRDDDADELEWYVPLEISPSDLQRTLNVINQFLETPIDLDGKKATQLLTKARRRMRRRSPSLASGDEAEASDTSIRRERRKEKKNAEKKQFKSAQFIEDSDEEYGDMEGFLKKEEETRLRAKLAAAAAGNARSGTMKATGTKKRRRKEPEKGSKKRRRNGQEAVTLDEGAKEVVDDHRDGESESDASASMQGGSPGHMDTPLVLSHARSNPKPVPISVNKRGAMHQVSLSLSRDVDVDPDVLPPTQPLTSSARIQRVIISSDEED